MLSILRHGPFTGLEARVRRHMEAFPKAMLMLSARAGAGTVGRPTILQTGSG